jgi:hypothetical protein
MLKRKGLRCTAQTKTIFASTPPAGTSTSTQQHGRSLFSLALIFILLPCAALAQTPSTRAIPDAAIESQHSALTSLGRKGRFTLSPPAARIDAVFDPASVLAQAANAPLPITGNNNPVTSLPAWRTEKSYLIPALEIVGFDVLLNLYDRAYYGCCEYDSDF